MNMILIDRDELMPDDTVAIDGYRARHIASVLKSQVGDRLRIGLLNGPTGTALIQSLQEDAVLVSCSFDDSPPPRPTTDLILAMPRPKVLARLWPQLAALGIGKIVILKADKVERSYLESHVLEPDFVDARLRAGLEQAGCTHMPRVFVERRFNPFVQDRLSRLFPEGLRLVATPSAEMRLGQLLSTHSARAGDGGLESNERVILAVGPEGGWNEYEIGQLREHHFCPVGLEKRILKSDTACIALIAIISEFRHLSNTNRNITPS